MKRTDPQSIRQIIDTVIDRAGNRREMQEHRAAYLWVDVVGPEINRLTTARHVRDGVLHVTISSASVKSELQFMKSTLVAHINEIMGAEIIKGIMIH